MFKVFLGHFDFFDNFRNWESKTGPLREGRAATERGRAGYKPSEGEMDKTGGFYLGRKDTNTEEGGRSGQTICSYHLGFIGSYGF